MGVASSVISQQYPPKSKFSAADIPDLSGKVVIVTGGGVGIGKETVKALLTHNAKVYIAIRNKEATMKAIEELKSETNKEAIFLRLDLSDLHLVKESAEEFKKGVMVPPIDRVTTQGYDFQFGTNTLGHFYFTTLLLPQLIAGAHSSSDSKARVVNVSSSSSEFANTIDFETLKNNPKRRKKGLQPLYAQSKLGNILFSNELVRRYGDQGIVSTSLNPGNIQSTLTRNMGYIQGLLIRTLFLRPTATGTLTQLYAGTSQAGATLDGKLIPWARVGKGHPAATPELTEKLWKWMEKEVRHI